MVGENQIEVDASSEAGDPLARLVELQDLLAIGLIARAEYDGGKVQLSRPDLKGARGQALAALAQVASVPCLREEGRPSPSVSI